MNKLSPMMQQYVETKKEYSDCILFYRLGDFYEMFFEDAKLVSRELELTLTGRDCGLEERAPMCGVPFHAADTYINRLINRGYKVAICEQVEDPKTAKGLVKREVIRIVTPGTNLNVEGLDESQNHYLMAVYASGDRYGFCIADVTTGDCRLTEADSAGKAVDEIVKYRPAEIICNSVCASGGILSGEVIRAQNPTVYPLEERFFVKETCCTLLKEHFHVQTMEGLGIADFPNGTIAAGALFGYLYEMQKTSLMHMTQIRPYRTDSFMMLDSSTRRNLELTETMREKKKKGSLLGVLDYTKTAMGARLLRTCVEQPLIDADAVNERLDAVEELNGNVMLRDEMREYLQAVYDLERLAGKISYQTVNPRDLTAFCSSLAMLPPVCRILAEFQSSLLRRLTGQLDELQDLYDLLESAICEDPPLALKDGGIIRDGYNEEVDALRKAKTEGKNWLARLEDEERQKTGIRNLKVKYNRIFGYYLEVTNSFKDKVPDYYTRKQTLANAERYFTPQLKELEDRILGAEDRLCTLEYELFCEIRDRLSGEMTRIRRTARAVAEADVLATFSAVSMRNDYVRPEVGESDTIRIRDGRHPVVEQMIPDGMFIPNDTFLDREDHLISVITGPNMAGKSTYMRQTALIVLMAQIGCFVPAREAEIGIVDRIFTRVGASDDLASGQSTFMVEMTEVAAILRSATPESLIILDEIGRGTSTFDGMSIAWAVLEHISCRDKLGAKTLFATHYHELTELEGKLPGVKNYCIAVREKGDDIIFLRKIVRGGADKSYGIQVARLAGVPDSVIARAKELVEELSNADILAAVREMTIEEPEPEAVSTDLLQKTAGVPVLPDACRNIFDEIRMMDVSRMTPLEALIAINRLQEEIAEIDGGNERK